MRLISFALACGLAYAASVPKVRRAADYEVNKTADIVYAQGVICNPPTPGLPAKMESTETCPVPTLVKLTLDLYTPLGAEALGRRPALVAIHSGGYSGGDKDGFKKEMAAACKYFASRGYVAITINYRLNNGGTGGGLAPANWSSSSSPLPSGWKGGFNPSTRSVYPAVRDAKAAIRWLRSMAEPLNLDPGFIAAAGWSAGACTTAHLASGFEWDFTTEMTAADDPTFQTIHADKNLSSSILAGAVWAGNSAVTDMKIALDRVPRWQSWNAPLAMYRGSKDTTMTQWAQEQVQRYLQAAGVRCDVFPVPGVDHNGLFPDGKVSNTSGMPVMDHSYLWLSEVMGLQVDGPAPAPTPPPGDQCDNPLCESCCTGACNGCKGFCETNKDGACAGCWAEAVTNGSFAPEPPCNHRGIACLADDKLSCQACWSSKPLPTEFRRTEPLKEFEVAPPQCESCFTGACKGCKGTCETTKDGACAGCWTASGAVGSYPPPCNLRGVQCLADDGLACEACWKLPPPSPPSPPSPPPSPSPPSGCPGGSYSACISMCPSDPAKDFKACLDECTKRCDPSESIVI